jgi:two-component system NtrC family sensor kinase
LQKAQQELIASDKQASIGRLAAGVAHEIGNPLSSLLGFTEILQMGMVSKKEENTYLVDMQREIQRISDIVRDLLDFSRQKELDLTPLDVNPTLERTWRLLSTLSEFKEVEVLLDLSNELPEVLLDENLLQQIATNIMVNAAQAMSGNGKLTVTSRFVGGEVLVGFQDNGPGVSPEHEKHLFEPFFTTKDVGAGTGLGLSVSLNLIEKCGGTITFRNTTPGALFTLHIPTQS